MTQVLRVALASDHAAVDERLALHDVVEAAGFEVLDLGPSAGERADYPAFAAAVAKAVSSGEAKYGVLLCGSGVGMSIAANKHRGIRAALVAEAVSARLARQHNDANVIVMGARTSGHLIRAAALDAFLNEPFTPGDDGRHARRVQMLEPAADED